MGRVYDAFRSDIGSVVLCVDPNPGTYKTQRTSKRHRQL